MRWIFIEKPERLWAVLATQTPWSRQIGFYARIGLTSARQKASSWLTTSEEADGREDKQERWAVGYRLLRC
jgi:hypothetical protein